MIYFAKEQITDTAFLLHSDKSVCTALKNSCSQVTKCKATSTVRLTASVFKLCNIFPLFPADYH